MITNLIPLSTFVLEQESDSTELLDVIQQVGALLERHNTNLRCAKFLQQKPAIEMFVVLEKYPDVMDFKIGANDKCSGWQYDSERKIYYDKLAYLKAFDHYQQAQDNVLFEQFTAREVNGHTSICYETIDMEGISHGLINVFWLTPIKGWELSNGIQSLEYLCQFNLPLTPKAQNIIYGK